MICLCCVHGKRPGGPKLAALAIASVVLAACWAQPAVYIAAAEQQQDGARLADEIELAHRWAAAAFAKPQVAARQRVAAPREDVLVVLHQSHKVLRRRTVWDTPLRLGDKQYAHGIFMDAPAALRVRLSRPAVEFTATVGIDNNESTRSNPEAGSARFHVVLGGKRVFSSRVLRLRDGPLHAKVPLRGAKEFVLDVDDGGNGRGWDQCSWADAAVKLADGSTLFLDELPLLPRRLTKHTTAPFSFTYDGRSSEALLPLWDYSVETQRTGEGRKRVVRYKCPKTGLVLECHVTIYDDAAAIDWVFFLKNEASVDTPIMEDFLPLDATLLEAAPNQSILLRWSSGDARSPQAFLPHDEPLEPGAVRSFAPTGGRSSNGAGGGAFPFFNVLGPAGGWVLAVGWSGQWVAEFGREPDGRLSACAGMEKTRFRLRPGESVRSPRIVLLRYLGAEMIRGHNRFRQLMLKHYVPRLEGQPAVPPVCHNTAATIYRSGQKATEGNQLAIIKKAAGLGCEAYWMDAYWFPQPWHRNVGNWYARPEDFPRGLRPLADAAHRAGMKFVLWFEPERVAPGTKLDREHPEFLLKVNEHGDRLFNLGSPAARQFLTNFLDQRIKQWGVDIYRNDFNIDPLPFWRKQDPDDRQGITEIRYVEGLYRMWSDLLRRNPGLTIDNCASGGRRIDLETCSLSYPLWRSDLNDIGEGLKGEAYWPRMARADQVHVTGLALYIPFQSGPLWDMRPYSFRSAMTSSVVLYERILHEAFPDELVRKGIAELKELRPLFLGDIYPLMKLTTSQKDWYAYQLHRPDWGRGCVFVFRRPDASDACRQIRLRQIDPAAMYLVSITGETYDTAPEQEMSGRELMDLTIRIQSRPGSALVRYCRACSRLAPAEKRGGFEQ
ncbi:MAG: hypothetical protein GXP27_00320 [Planctomycetes bacterium]|nr:hypothetical protein [Planctomycetota bacterium]